jgi:phosphatidylinositol glycan class B
MPLMPVNKFHKLILAVAFIVYLITAINSKGYFHFDEHYQIIEFANLKLGVNEPSDLAWEYQAQIRPAIQPAICVVVFKMLHATGITDAYTLALSLRLLTLLLALTAISLFVRSSLPLVESKIQKLYILLSYLLWFLPFINVRFSSETWSGLLFLFAVAILQLNLSKRKIFYALAGLLLGLCFLCRFQSAFLIVGLLGWLIIIHKESKQNISIIISAACLALLSGFAIDGWFYEKLVFTPWNYFNINILKGVASEFGTLPWNYYFGTIFRSPTIPIGSLILSCLCILIYKKPKLLLLWVILPFLIVHSVIPHKEDRFLFPIVNFIPLLIVLGWQEIRSCYQNTFKYRIFRLPVFISSGLLIVINTVGLIAMASISIGNGTKAITYYIHKNYKDKSVNLIYNRNSNPYNPLYLLSLRERFYEDKNVKEINMQQLLEEDDTIINNNDINLFVFQKTDFNDLNFMKIIKEYNLKPIIRSIPEWVEWINQYYNYSDSRNIITLYGNK